MKVQVLGMMGVKFTNNSGEEINGTNIFAAFQDENVQGFRTEKFFVKAGIPLPKDIKINDTIEMTFDFRGKLLDVKKA